MAAPQRQHTPVSSLPRSLSDPVPSHPSPYLSPWQRCTPRVIRIPSLPETRSAVTRTQPSNPPVKPHQTPIAVQQLIHRKAAAAAVLSCIVHCAFLTQTPPGPSQIASALGRPPHT
ncbi:hypothetical protein PMIN03_010306 [Paraphaeosphaeria minitans]